MARPNYRSLLSCFTILLNSVLTGCGGGGGTPAPGPSAPAVPLGLTPTSVTIDAGTSKQFAATGGTTPYTFSVTEGQGSIDAHGLYSASSGPGTATVKVADSAGASLTARITINSALTLTPSSATLTASSGQTLLFSAAGGGGPYQFSVASGSGTIDSNGLYTAGNTAGSDVVQVTDTTGGSVSVSVRLVRIRTNGIVNTMIVDPSGTYLGGAFSAVNPYLTSRAAVLDPTSGKPVLSCNLGTGFDAAVNASVIVGSSLYVGGSFTSFNGHPAHGLAKLDAATCALDATFSGDSGISGLLDPSVGAPAPPVVNSLSSNGSALFVGGNFAQYRGVPANGLVKIDLQSGAPDLAFTQASGPNHVVTLVAASADSVFINGEFTTYRGTAVYGRVPLKLNATSGNIDPDFVPLTETNRAIDSMLVAGGSLYISGDFSVNNPGIKKLDLATGAVDTTFAQGVSAIPHLVGQMAASGASLFVAGSYTDPSNGIVHGVAKIDATTGAPDPSFTRFTPMDQAAATLSVSGGSVYIAGIFGTYGGQHVPGLARLDASTGTVDAAFGLVPGFDFGSPLTLVATPNAVYVAGAMLTYGGTPAQNIAKLNTLNGTPDLTFLQAPGPDNAVSKLLLSGTNLYVGGQFGHYGAITTGSLAKVDSLTGIADPQFSTGGAFGVDFNISLGNPADVLTLALKAGSLYVGGLFSSYRGQPAAPLVKLDASTGALDSAFVQPGDFTALGGPFYFPLEVTSLALSADSLYVAGNFSTYRGTARPALAKLDPTTGAIDPGFFPGTSFTLSDIQFNSTEINAVLISGNSLFLAGSPLTLAGGVKSTGLAKVNLLTGAPDSSFTRAVTLSNYSLQNTVVKDLAQVGSAIYAAGNFVHYTGGAASYPQNLVKYDPATGQFDSTFSQTSGPDGTVNSVTVSGSSIYVNGAFDAYRGTVNPYSIAIDPTTGASNDR